MIKLIMIAITVLSILQGCVSSKHPNEGDHDCKQIMIAVKPYLDSLYMQKVRSKKWRVIGCSKEYSDSTYTVKTKLKGKGNFFGIDIKVDKHYSVIDALTILSSFD